MTESLSANQLAAVVNQWCLEHQVSPASGQAGDRITERVIRYYRSLGLLDPPLVGAGQGFGERHQLQLMAIRLLQAQGLPLNRIRELLFGRTVEELQRIKEQGLAELGERWVATFQPSSNEMWGVTPLDEEFLLVSRRGRRVSGQLREELLRLLRPDEVNRRR